MYTWKWYDKLQNYVFQPGLSYLFFLGELPQNVHPTHPFPQMRKAILNRYVYHLLEQKSFYSYFSQWLWLDWPISLSRPLLSCRGCAVIRPAGGRGWQVAPWYVEDASPSPRPGTASWCDHRLHPVAEGRTDVCVRNSGQDETMYSFMSGV